MWKYSYVSETSDHSCTCTTLDVYRRGIRETLTAYSDAIPGNTPQETISDPFSDHVGDAMSALNCDGDAPERAYLSHDVRRFPIFYHVSASHVPRCLRAQSRIIG